MNAAPNQSTQILIAGVGNVLHADDGFGIALANRLQTRTDLPKDVKVIETGIGGMSLIQEAMSGCRALLILDAAEKGGEPGQLYFLEPELPDLDLLDPHDRRAYFADTHYATPERALSLLQNIGRLPPVVRILGCEPTAYDDLFIGLSPPVEAALEPAERMALDWVGNMLRAATITASSGQ